MHYLIELLPILLEATLYTPYMEAKLCLREGPYVLSAHQQCDKLIYFYWMRNCTCTWNHQL